MENELNSKGTIQSEYKKMRTDREAWLSAAKEAAKYTIPSIMPSATDLTTHKINSKKYTVQPNQSVGADGVNNLSAKVTTTLLPPNQTFFKFRMDKALLNQIAQSQGIETETYEKDVNTGLANLETMLLDYQGEFGDRACLGEALKHLYITGNVLLVFNPDTGLKYYPLSRFVIKRDYSGNTQKVITEEKIAYRELPKEFQEQILNKYLTNDENKCKLEEKEFILYTKYHKCKNNWKVIQEIEGTELQGSEAKFPLDICPVIPLRYVRVDGESYGRGLIEDYIGDISYLDVLSLAIKEAALAGSKFIMLVNPAGTTKARKLATAKNGDFIEGRADDVQPLQANKYYDLQTAQQQAAIIEQRLQRIFCMKSAIQRRAERVTAEEIRQMAADLEEALGNHYALMSREFQLAYTKLTYYFFRKTRKNILPDLLKEKSIKLIITTGLEALGRTSDLNKLVTFVSTLGQLAPVVQPLGIKTDALINKIAVSLNLDVSDMFYTEEEKQAINGGAIETLNL